MRNILYLFAIVASFALFSCSSDDVAAVKPSDISNIRHEEQAGAIKLMWDLPADKNLAYVQVTYFDPLTKKDALRLASVYGDTLLIPDTRQKYGDYNFTLQAFSETETPGTALDYTARSGAAPTIIRVIDQKQLQLSADGLFTDAQEPSEGPIANLLDGNSNTFFHARWSGGPTPLPHYIVVKLPKKIEAMSFEYTTRNAAAAGNHPKTMNIYVSNEFDGETYDVSGLKLIDELDGMPNGAAQSFRSDEYVLGDAYEYVWLEVTETHGGTVFFAMSILNINELVLDVYDPEAPTAED